MLNSKIKVYDVIIIGAGFSGCITAKYLDNNLSVMMVDQNNLILKKFLMTGKGYSNITNTLGINDFLNNIIDNNKFLYSSLSKYNSKNILEMCDDMKIRYFEKTPNRIHLLDSNEKFKEIFLNELIAKPNLDLKFNIKITSITHNIDHFVVTNRNIETYYAKNVVIATGGMSFGKFTGSDGYGYVLAQQFKHTIKPIYPIGVGIDVNDQQLLNLQASTMSNVCVTVYDQNNKPFHTETSELIFTHYGLGGPVIRRVSGYVSKQLIKYSNVKIIICFFDQKVILEELKKYRYLNQCFRMANKKVMAYLFDKIKININSETSNLTKQQVNSIIDGLSKFELNIKKTRSIAEATNTGGGINLKEINPSTFMSKLQPNLYFIGEVIDLNPRTNGFNLTACYCSARVVADQLNDNIKHDSSNVK